MAQPSTLPVDRKESRVLPLFRNGYNTTLTLLTATLCLIFPACSYAVFGMGADRARTAEVISSVYVVVMLGLMSAPWLPFPSLAGESRYRRLERMVYIWILVHTLTAVTWELPFLLFHERIASAQNELWAYTWWAYIDGGDSRYTEPTVLLFFIEAWSCTNGVIGLAALRSWFRSEKQNPLPVYYFMFAAPLHIYPTLLYYATEIFEGMPHVDTGSFVNLVLKFALSNSFWVVLPGFVLVWGKQTLERIYAGRCARRAET